MPSVICSELQYEGDKSVYLQCEKQQHRRYGSLKLPQEAASQKQTHNLRLNPGMNQHLGSPHCQDGLCSCEQAHSNRDFLLTRAAAPAQRCKQKGLGAEPQPPPPPLPYSKLVSQAPAENTSTGELEHQLPRDF